MQGYEGKEVKPHPKTEWGRESAFTKKTTGRSNYCA